MCKLTFFDMEIQDVMTSFFKLCVPCFILLALFAVVRDEAGFAQMRNTYS